MSFIADYLEGVQDSFDDICGGYIFGGRDGILNTFPRCYWAMRITLALAAICVIVGGYHTYGLIIRFFG